MIKKIINFQRLILLTFFIACGGGGGGENNSNPELNQYELKKIADNPNFPIRLESLDKTRLLIADLLTGDLKLLNLKTSASEIIAKFPKANRNFVGISGLLIDKDFPKNGIIFVYHLDDLSNKNVVSRLTLENFKVVDRKILLFLSSPSDHNGGGMTQDHDGSIFLGLGDSNNAALAQEPNNQSGKIIKFNRDGELLENPSGIIASGLRNPFGLTYFKSKVLIADNGPDCDDEINVLEEGANFGWKENYICSQVGEGQVAPIFSWEKSEGITDLTSLEKNHFKELKNSLLVARYNSNSLTALTLNELLQVTSETEIISNSSLGPFIDIHESSDGRVFMSSPSAVYELTR